MIYFESYFLSRYQQNLIFLLETTLNVKHSRISTASK